jgi:hypothetical protein
VSASSSLRSPQSTTISSPPCPPRATGPRRTHRRSPEPPSTGTPPSRVDLSALSSRRRLGASPPFCLVWHLPLIPRELSPMVPPHLVARLNVASRASPPPHVWPPRGDHGQRAHRARVGWAELAAEPRGRPPCHRTRAGVTRAPHAVDRFEARHCAAIFN